MAQPFDLINISDEDIENYRWMRWKARTDLIWLCNFLDMPDVSRELNGTLIDRIQQFPKPINDEQMREHDRFDRKNGWSYTPLCRDPSKTREHLPDPNNATLMGNCRRRLIIDSRGTMKTYINIRAHTVQWILNYPDIGIGIFQSSKPKAIAILKSIKAFFQYHQELRALFPDICPDGNVADWGTTEEFIVKRTPGFIRIDPTVKALSLETKMAGMHFEVLKFTDVVERDNSRNEQQLREITEAFDASERILVGSQYWIDVEGTMWNPGDLYNEIIAREKDRQRIKKVFMVGTVPLLDKREAETAAKVTGHKVIEMDDFYVPQPHKRRWQVYINCIFKRADPNPSYDYDDIISIRPDKLEPSQRRPDNEAKLLFSEDGLPVSRWESRHPAWKMVEDLKKNPNEFNFQMMNCPTGSLDGIPELPMDQEYPQMISRRLYRERIRVMYYDASIDIADSTGKRSDYSCISIGGFDGYGRCYVPEIRHGKWQHHHLIEQIFEVHKKYSPQRWMLEKGMGSNAFMSYLNREMELRGIWLNIVRVPRPTKMRKAQRISQTLQPYWINKEIIFLDDINPACWEMFKAEVLNFPNPRHDDILDTIADLFYGKVRYGRQIARSGKMPEDMLITEESEMNRRLAHAVEQARTHGLRRLMEGTAPGAKDVHSYYRLTGGF